MPVDRRTLLRLAGGITTVSAASMAGCTGGNDGGPSNGGTESGGGAGGSALYTPWLWVKENDEGNTETTFVSAEWKKLNQMESTNTETGSQGSGQTVKEELNDPLLSPAAGGLFLIGFGVGFGLFGTGLEGLITYNSDEESDTTSSKTAADYATSIETILGINDQFVLLGEIDTEEIATALSESSLVEREGLESYTVYGPEEVDSDGGSQGSFSTGNTGGIAFDSTAIIMFSPEEREALETLVATRAGDSTRATEANSNLQWLIETAGSGDLVFGAYGSELDDEESLETSDQAGTDDEDEDSSLDIDSAVGFSSQLTFDSTSSTSGSLAVQFDKNVDEIEQEKIDELRTNTGSTASEQSFDIDGKRLTATATWDGNAFDNIYKESETESDTDSD